MFLPDRYIKGTCPKCGTKDQYGDACENCGSTYAPTDLIDPYSTLTGAQARAARRPSTCSSGCPIRRSSRSSSAWTQRRDAAAARGAQQDPGVAGRRGGERQGSPTGTSRATRRTSASRSPTRPASTSTSGSTRRSATSRASRSTSTRARRARIRRDAHVRRSSSPIPDVEQYHFIGKDIVYFHTLFWPAMLRVRRQPYKTPTNVFVHGFLTALGREDVEVARHRHQPAASTSTSA